MFKKLIFIVLLLISAHSQETFAKSRSKITSTQFRKKPKRLPLRKFKPRPFKGVLNFRWPEGLEFFSSECPNRGVIEEIYGKAPNLLYEVRVTCKGNIERYEHFFLIRQSLVIKITNK